MENNTQLTMSGEQSEYSKATASGLSKAGRKVTDAICISAAKACDSSRTMWLTNAVKLGIILEAKRLALGHGSYGKWLEGFAEKYNACSSKTLRNYQFLAKRYIIALELRDQGDARSTLTTFASSETATQIAVATPRLAELAIESPAMFGSDISNWLAGRSFREMMTDLREAEKAALRAEREDANTLDADDEASPTAGLPGVRSVDRGMPLVNKLANDWHRKDGDIDSLFQSLRTSVQVLAKRESAILWAKVAQDLEAKAAEARRMADALGTSLDDDEGLTDVPSLPPAKLPDDDEIL